MLPFRLSSSILVAAGALLGSSAPSAALISLHLPGGGYYRHMGGGMHPMPTPPMPKPPMPKPPMGGWGGGHAGGWGGHGSAWHVGGWGNGHTGGGSGGWHTGGGHPGNNWHTGSWHTGGSNWHGNGWHAGSWRPGNWGYRPVLGYHPSGTYYYGTGGASGYGSGGGYASGGSKSWGSGGGGSLYARYSAQTGALLARFGGGDLSGHYGSGSYPKPPTTWGSGGTRYGSYSAYKYGYSYKYAYGYKAYRGQSGGGSPWGY